PTLNEVSMQRFVPFLWFDGRAEEAMNFYVSIFKNSKVGRVSRYGDAGPGPKGSVMSCTFQLEGQDFYALNGGPQFKFTPAISLFVNCETQQEVDELWEKLSRGGSKDQCGWLKDKFGVSWQVVPTVLGKRRPGRSGHARDAGGRGALLGTNHSHDVRLPGRHIHLTDAEARQQHENGERKRRHQRYQHEQDVRRQMREHHGLDEAEARG